MYDFLGRTSKTQFDELVSQIRTEQGDAGRQKRNFLKARMERYAQYQRRVVEADKSFTGESISTDDLVEADPMTISDIMSIVNSPTRGDNPRSPNDTLPALIVDDLKNLILESIKSGEIVEYYVRKSIDVMFLIKERLRVHDAELMSGNFEQDINKMTAFFNGSDYDGVLVNDVVPEES